VAAAQATTAAVVDPDPTAIDPDSGLPWSLRLDTKGVARYLRIVHGLPVAVLTLVRQRTRGVGIRWKYLGQKPIVERNEIDRYVREDALRDVSPLRAGAQARAKRKKQEQQQQQHQQPKSRTRRSTPHVR
jgi:hypothetical protein